MTSDIKKAYEDYQSLHIRNYINIPITHQHSACSTYKRADKSKFRAYKNFQIYLTNYWRLLNAINNTNDNFKKLKNKISVYRDNITKENQKDLCRNIEQLLETVAFERELS